MLVAPGEYVENIVLDNKSIALIGNPQNPEEVVIDGDSSGTVVTINGGNEFTKVCGFTIQNGSYPSGSSGGGIDINESSLVLLSDLHIQGNFAFYGGGISSGYSSPIILNCLIENNIAARESGGIRFLNRTWERIPQVLNSVIHNNSANESGGGIGAYYLSLIIENTLIDSNHAYGGGGIFIWDAGDIIIKNSTIVNNISRGVKGGLSIDYGDFDVELLNCILWGNIRNREINSQIYIGSGDLNISYSDIEGGRNQIYCAGGMNNYDINWRRGNINSDPLFVDPENGNYQLSEDSPCIDTGDPDSPDDPDSTRADMGVFYFRDEADYPAFFLVNEEMDFGEVLLEESRTIHLGIFSIGAADLRIIDVSSDRGEFTTDFEEEFIIRHAFDAWIPVTFTPEAHKEVEGVLSLETNARHHRNIEIPLHGFGVDPRDVKDSAEDARILRQFSLFQNYPNPFNSTTRLKYGLPEDGLVNISVYDIFGRLVETLVSSNLVAGNHFVTWDANSESSGLYFIEMKSKGFTQVRKIVLTK